MPWSKYFSLIWGQPHIAVIQTETCGIKLIRAVGFVDNWHLPRKMQCRTSFRKITQTPEALKSDLEIFREAGVCRQLNDRLSLPRHSHWSHSTDSLKRDEQIAGNCFAVAKTCRRVSPGRGEGTHVFAVLCCTMSHRRVYCSLLCFLPARGTLCHFLIPWWLSGASFAEIYFHCLHCAPLQRALGGFGHKRGRELMLQCGMANFLTSAPLGQGP